jgi:hypothetical protein
VAGLAVWAAGKNNGNNTRYQFWRQHNLPIELSTNEITDQKLENIHQNPFQAGIVLRPEDYLYSSTINYAGMPEELIEVILI